MEEYINSDSDFDLRSLMVKDDSKWILLLGSAVSIWSPSDIPNGQEIRRAIYQILNLEEIIKSPAEGEILKEYLERMPFELLMYKCPIDKILINKIFIDFFSNFKVPNSIHTCLGNMFVNGMVDSIITPNYDLCLENAITKLIENRDLQYSAVAQESDVYNVRENNKCIFKIHGSVDGPSQDLIFMMNQEGRLPGWKSNLLKRLIEGKNVLVIGYSGYDFDICPELSLANPKKIYWNFFSKKEADNSANARHVAEQTDTCFLYGDMRYLLKPFLSEEANKSGGYIDHINSLQDNFMENIDALYLKLWRIKVFNTLNFNRIVIKEVDELLKRKSHICNQLLLEKAIALVNSGRYDQGGALYSRLAEASEDINDKNLLFSLAEHSWLASGDTLKYLRHRRRRKSKLAKQYPSCNILQDEQNFIQFLSYLCRYGIPFISKIIRRIAKKKIESTGERYHSKGDWHGIYRLQVLAAELNFEINDIQILGVYKLPTIENAYQQVAFPIGEMMASRKYLKRNNSDKNNRGSSEKWEKLLDVCENSRDIP